jgi:hypothetical protein
MKRLLTTMLLLAAWTCGAQAGPVEDLTAAVANKRDAIAVLNKYRDYLCVQFKDGRNRDACSASYDALVARREAEKSILVLWLAGYAMDQFAQRIVLEDIAPRLEFNRMEADTTAMFERTRKAFHIEESEKAPAVPNTSNKATVPYVLPAQPLVVPEPFVPAPMVLPIAKLPASGIMHAKKGSIGVARLGVVTPPEQHYLLRFVNEDGRKREITFFVRADSDFEGKVPLGKYRIVGVHGTTWYGDKDYFGDESVFFKLRTKDQEEVFAFWKDKTTIHGRKFTFKSVVDGNIATSPIDRAEFENN